MFINAYAFLSNFYPCQIEYEGIIFPSVEHAYQAAKTPIKSIRLECLDMRPREAKKWGTTIPIRQDWEDVNLDIMRELTRKKFSHPSFAKKLLDTGDVVIEETNYWHDTFWGVCNGIGENWLGKILMEVREELKNDV